MRDVYIIISSNSLITLLETFGVIYMYYIICTVKPPIKKNNAKKTCDIKDNISYPKQ